MPTKKISPEAASKLLIEFKAEKKKLEKRIEELEEVMEPYLEEQPDGMAEFHGFKFTLVKSERENFSLKKAREKIDGRILAPYVTTSQSQYILMTWKGGVEEAA